MKDNEESKLIIEIDRKLAVLINSVSQEVKSNDEFKFEMKKTIDSTQSRLREIEIWKSKTEVNQEDDKFLKQTVIRWVVAGMLTSIGSAVALFIKLT